MVKSKKAVDLLVADMEKKSKAKTKAFGDTVHAPDSRVAAFAMSYLDAFGYLKRELGEWRDISISDILDGLVHFQEMFKLPKTKALTVQTVKAMECQRCGCPDVQRAHLGCKAMQKTIGLRLPKWKKAGLTYFVKNRVPGMPADSFDAAVRSGFLAWSIYTNLSVTAADSPDKADITFDLGKGPQSNFDGPGGTLAWATLPDGSDKPLRITFDEDETWTLDPRQHGVCLHNVMRHEIGHCLGLTHSKVPTALMAGMYNPVVRDPQQEDDVARLLARYGVEERKVAPVRPATVNVPVRAEDALAALTQAGYKIG